jgi:hypothetical protein
MRFKNGVKIMGLQPELLAALAVCDDIYQKFYNTDMVVTSAVDGKHAITSLHYAGAAADLRTRNIDTVHWDQLAEDLRLALTSEFDVVLEADHIHLEFQPKRPA